MDAQELRNLQETYTEVYNELDEELTGARRMKALDIMRKEKFKGKKARQVADIVSGKEGSKSPSGEGINLPTKRGGGGEKKEPKTGRGGDWYADRGVKKEQVDIYDIILSHLLDEGYASTQESADKIILNMSESWFENIMELNRYEKETGKDYKTGKEVTKGGTMGGDDTHSKVMRHMHKVMGAGRMGAGGPIEPRGKKKEKGKKPPKAGEYGGPASPEQKVKKRRADAQRAKDMMHSARD